MNKKLHPAFLVLTTSSEPQDERLDLNELWHLYSSGKQIYGQLAVQFGCSTKTIQRSLDKALIVKRKEFSGIAVVIMDTTYFGRGFGVMVFKNSLVSLSPKKLDPIF